MNVKSLIIAGVTALSLAAPAAALADPDWGRGGGGYHQGGYDNGGGWRGGDDRRDGRGGEWRGQAYYGQPAYGWGDDRRCWTSVRPYRTWFGGIAYRRVWECR